MNGQAPWTKNKFNQNKRAVFKSKHINFRSQTSKSDNYSPTVQEWPQVPFFRLSTDALSIDIAQHTVRQSRCWCPVNFRLFCSTISNKAHLLLMANKQINGQARVFGIQIVDICAIKRARMHMFRTLKNYQLNRVARVKRALKMQQGGFIAQTCWPSCAHRQ